MQKDEVILNISTKEISKREDPTNQIKHEVLRFEQTSVLNKNGEAPQCSCTIVKCTIMESSLPQNYLGHSTSARVHNAKENHSTCTKDMFEPKRRYQFSKIQHKIGPTEIKGGSLKEYVHKLRDTNWKLKPIENAKS